MISLKYLYTPAMPDNFTCRRQRKTSLALYHFLYQLKATPNHRHCERKATAIVLTMLYIVSYIFLSLLSPFNNFSGTALIKCALHYYQLINHDKYIHILVTACISLNTGRCKSSFHHFLHEVMHGVNAYLKDHCHETKQMFLPFCTWDKFGDILANSGG